MSLRKACIFGLLGLLLLPLSASAQMGGYSLDDTYSGEPSGSIQGAFLPLPFGGPFANGHFWARGDFGDRPGADGNYFSTGAFTPIQLYGPQQMFILEGQMWVLEDGEIGGDIGFGSRWMLRDFSQAVGLNAFLTWDRSLNKHRYRRVSIGGEWMTDYLEVFANGYLPWNDDVNNVGGAIPTNEVYFEDMNLVFMNFQFAEQQLTGADIEVGSPIPGLEWLSLYGGAYYFDSDRVGDFTGVSGRASIDLTSAVFDIVVQNDSQFGTSLSVGGELRVGYGPLVFTPRYRNLTNKVLERVRKRSRISTRQFLTEGQELAINPATGLPFVFKHVDNTAANGGDGSFENRWDDLSLATGSGADIILVWRGDTTRQNLLPGSTGLVLSNNQIVVGEGTDFAVLTQNRPDPIALPAPWDPTGTNPFVGANPNTNIITLANNNTIIGLNMIAPVGGHMIRGSGINNFTIIDINQNINPIQNTGLGGGIYLTNARGQGYIENFSYRTPNPNATGGIVIRNTNTQPLNLTVQDAPFLNGGQYGIDLVANNSSITAALRNVQASGNGTGLRTQATNGGQILATVNPSTFNNSTDGPGIHVVANSGGYAELLTTSTSASGAATDGLRISLNNGSAVVGMANGSLANAGVDAVRATLTNDSDLVLNLQNMNGSNAGRHGLNISLNDSTMGGLIQSSNFSGAGNNGINAVLQNSSDLLLDVRSTDFSNAANNGMRVDATTGSQFEIGFRNGSLANAQTGHGIRITLNDADGILVLDGTDVSGAAQSAFSFLADNGSTFNATLQNGVNLSNAAAGSAIFGEAFNGSSVMIAGNGVSGANAGSDAIFLNADNSELVMMLNGAGNFSNAGGHGISFTGTNDAFLDVRVSGSPANFSNAGGRGVNGTLTDSRANLVLNNTNFDSAASDGLAIAAVNSTITGGIVNSLFTNAGGTGLLFDLDSQSRLGTNASVFMLDNVNASGAAGDGLYIDASTGSLANVNAINGLNLSGAQGTAAGTMGDALRLSATGNSRITFLGSGVSGADAANDGINVNAVNSDITLGLTNTGSFANSGGDGLDFTATNNSDVVIGIQGPASFSDAPGMGSGFGVVGTVLSGSDVQLVLDGLSFDNAGLDGFDVRVNGGTSTFMGAITNSSFDDAEGRGMRLRLQNGSTGSLSLTNTSANGAQGGDGLLVNVSGASTGTVELTNAQFNDAAIGNAVSLVATGGSTLQVAGSGVSGANAGNHGINVTSTNSFTQIDLVNVGSFAGAGQNGVNISVTGGAFPDFQFNLAGTAANPANFTGAGNHGLNIVLNNHNGFDAGDRTFTFNRANFNNTVNGNGFNLISTNSTFRGLVTNSSFNQAADNAFFSNLDNNPLSELRFQNTTMANATVDAVHAIGTNNTTFDLFIQNGDLTGAGQDAVDFNYDGTSTFNLTINPTALGAARHGIVGVLTDNSTANISLTQSPITAGESGIDLSLSDNSVANLILNQSNIDYGTGNGIGVRANTGSSFNATVSGSTIDGQGAGMNGVFLDLNDATASMLFNQNSSVVNAGQDNIRVDAFNNSQAGLTFSANSGNLSGAGGNGIALTADGPGSGILATFNGAANLNGAGGAGAALTATDEGQVGIIAQSLTAIGGAGHGIDILADGANSLAGIQVAGAVDVSNSGGDGLRIFTTAGGTAGLTANSFTGNDVGGSGIILDADGAGSEIQLIIANGISVNDAVGGDGVSASARDMANLILTAGSLSAMGAGGNGLALQSDDATLVATFGDFVNLNGAGLDGLLADATNGGTIDFQATSLTVNGTTGNGVVLNADGPGSLINALLNGPLNADNVGGNGLQLSALAGGQINLDANNGLSIQNVGVAGIDALADGGIIVLNADGGLDISGAPGATGEGISLVADNGGMIDLSALGGLTIEDAGLTGLLARTDNGSTINVDVMTFLIENSGEHGVAAFADGDSDITLSLLDGVIQGSGQNVTPGHGLLAIANGNGAPMDGSLITITLMGVDVLDNMGDGINLEANMGNNIAGDPQMSGIIFNYASGTVAGNNLPPMDGQIGWGISATANGGGTAGDTVISMTLTNVDVASAPFPPGNEEGSIFLDANNGGVIEQDITGGQIDGPVVVCADGAGSFATLSLNNVLINPSLNGGNPDAAAIVLCAINDGTVNASFSNMTAANGTAISGHGGQAVAFKADTGGQLTADFTNIDMTGNLLGLPGIMNPLPAGHPDEATFMGFGVEAVIQGMVTGAGTVANVNFTDVNIFNNTGANAFQVAVAGGGEFNTNVTNMTIFGNDASAGEGEFDVRVDGAGSTATINVDGLTANNSDGHGVNILGTDGAFIDLTLNNVTANGAAENGLNVVMDGAGTELADFSYTSSSFNNAEVIGVNIVATNGATLNQIFTNPTSANGAQEQGLNIFVDATSFINGPIEITGFSANNAGQSGMFDAISIDIQNATVPLDVTLQNVSATNATGGGVNLNITGAAVSGTLTLDSVVASGAQGGPGLNVDVNNIDGAFDITMLGTNNFSFNQATAPMNTDAVRLALEGAMGAGSTTDISIDGLTANNATAVGVNFLLTGELTAAVTSFNDVTANNAALQGVRVRPDLESDVVLTQFNANNVTVNDAGSTGLDLRVANQSETIDIVLNDITANNAGTPPAVVVANGVNVVLDNVGGGMDNTLSLSNVAANGATGNGLAFLINDNTVVDFLSFDGVTANNNRQAGLRFDVTDNSQLLTLSATGITLNNNTAQSTTDASLMVNVTGSSEAGFDLTDLTINGGGTFGLGLLLNVQDTSVLAFDVDGTTINDTGRETVQINVGTTTAGATFTGNFSNLDVTTGGTAPLVQANGFDVNVIGAGSNATITLDNVSSNNHQTGDGFNFLANGGASLDVEISNGSTASGNQGRGLFMNATDMGTTVSLISDSAGGAVNMFNNNGLLGGANNGGHGVHILLEDQAEGTFDLEASANNNFGDGIRIIANDGSGVTINSLGITATGVNVDNNGGNGLTVDLNAVSGITNFDLSGMQVNDNVGDQINVRFTDMMLDEVNFNQIIADGPGSAAGTGSGIVLTLDNTQIANSLGLNNIIARNNGQDGLRITLLNGATIPMGSAIDLTPGITQDSLFVNNGRHGINIQLNNSMASLDIFNSQAAFGRVSSASNNGGRGINIELQNGSTLSTNIDQQLVNGNASHGIFIGTTGNSTFDSGTSITRNTINNNNGIGIHGRFLGGDFDLSIGSRTNAGFGNVINNNAGAGIGIEMIQDAEGRIAVLDNTITNTRNLAGDANYNGDGFLLRMLGTGGPSATNLLEDTIDNGPGLLIEGNLIGTNAFMNGANQGNTGFGINFDLRETSAIDSTHILNNAISFNGSGGIRFERRDAVGILDTNAIGAFVIDDNRIESNTGNGITLRANNSALAGVMNITIGSDTPNAFQRTDIANWLDALDGNIINANAGNGILIDAITDSQLNVDMFQNYITRNTVNGILLTETALSGDTRLITGEWDQNVISHNTSRGIMSNARANLLITNGILGAVLDQFGNVLTHDDLGLLDGNGHTGIELNGLGTYTIGQTLDTDSGLDIIRNGRLQTPDRSVGHGIDIQGATKTVNVFNSQIRANFQDGIEIFDAGASHTILLEDNRIVSNVGRGIDVLKRPTGTLFLTIQGTNDPRANPINALAQVNSNGEEGIYIVATSSTTQNQSDFSFEALAQDGGLNSTANINARVSNVAVNFNGNDIGNEGNALRPAGSGLVVRVGTMNNGGSSVTNTGGFASTANSGATPSGRNNSRGGVVMRVDSNYVEGNVGDGMFFHGFRSTTEPGSGTTWNQTTFNATGYQPDPLARLDLIWGVNDGVNDFTNMFAGGDLLNANNAGLRGNPQGQAGAFYNNSDGQFKSRLNNIAAPNIAGPFTSATRRRNAQRQALRVYPDGTVLAPTDGMGNPHPSGANFVYPGMGDSTFRVIGFDGAVNSGANAFLPATPFPLGGFNFDSPSPIMSPGDINGTGFTGAIFGELPFGWGLIQ